MKKTPHEFKMEKARKSIEELWSDQTTDVEEIIGSLVTLIGEIEIIVDALRSMSG